MDRKIFIPNVVWKAGTNDGDHHNKIHNIMSSGLKKIGIKSQAFISFSNRYYPIQDAA